MAKDTVYPWKLIILMTINNLFLYFVLFSFPTYVPQCIQSYGVAWDKVGDRFGIFNGLFFASVGLGNLVPACIMTMWSNKGCLITMQVLLGFSLITFGLSNSLTYLYVNGAMIGLFLSVISASKVIVYNISLPETEKKIALWAFSGPCILGQVIGPGLAGVISFPAKNFPSYCSKTSIFGKYPALLINLAYGLGLLIISFAVYVLFPGDKDLYKTIHCYNDPSNSSAELLLLGNNDSSNDFQEESSSPSYKNVRGSFKQTMIDLWQLIWNEIISKQSAFLAILLFAGATLTDDAYLSLLPLWLATPSSLFGRDYSTDKIGFAFLASGTFFVLINYTLVSSVNRKCRPRSLYALWMLMLTSFTVWISLLGYIKNTKIVFVLCVLMNTLIMSALSGLLTCCQVILQRSVNRSAVALVIGLSQTANMIAASLGNWLLGVLFAWSLKNADSYNHRTGYPFGYHFSFIVLSFLYIVAYIPLFGIRIN